MRRSTVLAAEIALLVEGQLRERWDGVRSAFSSELGYERNLTHKAQRTLKGQLDSCEWLGSAEEVFASGADDTGGEFGGRLEPVAADQDDGGTFGLTHEEAGGGGELVGDGKDRRG